MQQTRRRIGIAVAILFGLLAFTACSGSSSGAEARANIPAQATTPLTVPDAIAPTGSETGVSSPVALTYSAVDGSLLKADNMGLLRWRADSGWEKIDTPQASAGLSGVVVHPEQPTTIYASGSDLGVIRSDDDAASWQSANDGLPDTAVTALAVDSLRQEFLYAWVRSNGIYRTEDGGASWRQVPDQGPPDTDVRGLTFSTLPGSMNTGWLYATTPTGAYLSMDCFCGWRTMGSLPSNAMVRSIAVDPSKPQRVYAAGPAGLFRSDDAGLTWEEANDGLSGAPLAVTLDPATPQTLFTVLTDGSVWRSVDGATTWQVLEVDR